MMNPRRWLGPGAAALAIGASVVLGACGPSSLVLAKASGTWMCDGRMSSYVGESSAEFELWISPNGWWGTDDFGGTWAVEDGEVAVRTQGTENRVPEVVEFGSHEERVDHPYGFEMELDVDVTSDSSVDVDISGYLQGELECRKVSSEIPIAVEDELADEFADESDR